VYQFNIFWYIKESLIFVMVVTEEDKNLICQNGPN